MLCIQATTLPVLHQERSHEAALPKVNGVFGADRDDVHGNLVTLHLLERPPNLRRAIARTGMGRQGMGWDGMGRVALTKAFQRDA